MDPHAAAPAGGKIVAWIVVPCFNEAQRLDTRAYGDFLMRFGDTGLLFVDDGSTDGTLRILQGIAEEHPGNAAVLHFSRNSGKAEAVRRGMLNALERRPRFVGYWDADLATPLDAIREFVAVVNGRPNLEIVFGARVKLLGRRIIRDEVRHYAGRVFATATSWTLGLPIYDTQCGAKLFVANEDLAAVLVAPFKARWVFDVEFLARLLEQRRTWSSRRLEDVLFEYPLLEWRDVAGSKLRLRDFARAALDLVVIKTTHHL
jgi:glycosyltransferase involved in cell wall biosynthesis